MMGVLYPNQKNSASTINMPSQKPGNGDEEDGERAGHVVEPMLLGLMALRMPIGRPTSQDTISASTPISALIGPRRRISSATVSPRKKDLPSWPEAMSFIQ